MKNNLSTFSKISIYLLLFTLTSKAEVKKECINGFQISHSKTNSNFACKAKSLSIKLPKVTFTVCPTGYTYDYSYEGYTRKVCLSTPKMEDGKKGFECPKYREEAETAAYICRNKDVPKSSLNDFSDGHSDGDGSK